MRRKLQLFVGEVMRIGSERLNHAESKMAEYYQRRLARKCIGRLKQNRVDEEAFK
jgi:hypothetical protein